MTKSASVKLMTDKFGIDVREMTGTEVKASGNSTPIGLVVTRVARKTQAASRGLAPGDFVTRIANIPVRSLDALGQTLKGLPPGREIPVGVLRVNDDNSVVQGDMFLKSK